jgi:hypothetical protein
MDTCEDLIKLLRCGVEIKEALGTSAEAWLFGVSRGLLGGHALANAS